MTQLEALDALVGEWTTSATHPMLPGVTVAGRTSFEWLEGRHFLIGRSRNDHPDFPDGLTVLGAAGDELFMRYYDSRGVERLYGAALEGGELRIWRDAPGFFQRFSATLGDDGTTLAGVWQLSRDDGATWDDDLAITYRRAV
jgi:hypothetical protein